MQKRRTVFTVRTSASWTEDFWGHRTGQFLEGSPIQSNNEQTRKNQTYQSPSSFRPSPFRRLQKKPTTTNTEKALSMPPKDKWPSTYHRLDDVSLDYKHVQFVSRAFSYNQTERKKEGCFTRWTSETCDTETTYRRSFPHRLSAFERRLCLPAAARRCRPTSRRPWSTEPRAGQSTRAQYSPELQEKQTTEKTRNKFTQTKDQNHAHATLRALTVSKGRNAYRNLPEDTLCGW